jgi:hypothetical protein
MTPKYKRHLLARIDTELENMKYIGRSCMTEDEELEAIKLGPITSEKQKKVKILPTLNKNKMEDKYFDCHFKPLKDTKRWE